MGYHAFVLRYSVYNKSNKFPDLSKELPIEPHSVYPNSMRDLAKAMLYIKDRSNEWNIDKNKIAICGFSAGGHNCAMYSINWNKPILTEHFGVDAESLKPTVCILGYALTDYIQLRSTPIDNPWAEALSNAARIALMGTTNPSQELLLELSPARLVENHVPPTFLWTTSEDALLPVSQTTAMAHALAENKIPFELHIFEDGPHGLSLGTQASADWIAQENTDAAKWMELCDRWLYKRFSHILPESLSWE
jgi:acetyl esterase/lipase